jgi:hypothetical protein
MDNNNYYIFIIPKLIYFLVIILFFQITNCLIEIPIEIITTKNIQNNNKKNTNNPLIFLEEGVTKINTNNLFLANIKIGSNSQIFRLVLDTGSSLTWVADTNIKIDGENKVENKFDPYSSSSCIHLYEQFNINYGSGSCSGLYYIDTIKYINNKEFQLKFGVAKLAKFEFSEADGIIGLSRSHNEITTSFISMLYESKIIDSKLFSFKFASNSLDIPMGKFFIGKHADFSKKNSFSCDLLSNNYRNAYYWTCELTYFGLYNSANGFTTYSNFSIPIIFDTGTNYIFLPYEYLREMEKDLNHFRCKISEYEEEEEKDKYENNNSQNRQYRLICPSNNVPQFHFMLGNTTFTLPSSLTFYYNGGLAYSYILFIINNNKESNPYIFGSSFFMSFHTLFNDEEKKLQFYPLDNNYIVKNKNYDVIQILVVFLLIISWGILFYMIFLFCKWKKEKQLEEYQNIMPNDINIEMSEK